MGKAKKLKKLTEGLKLIGDKVVKKRMTTKERNEMSKPFKKMLSDAQKSKKGMSKKEFDARVKKGMAEDARIAKVKAENMAAATGPIKPKKKAAGGMMSPQPMPARSRPPMPPRPPKPRPRRKPRTELIDPRLPRGKAGKGPLEPSDSTTRVPSQRKGLAGMLKKRMATQSEKTPKKLKKGPGMKKGGVVKKAMGGMLGPHPQQGRPMNIAAPQGPRAKQPLRNMTVPYGKIAKKGPGLKDGGSVKKYKAGGTVSKSKATGAAKRGFGKAYMKGKRS